MHINAKHLSDEELVKRYNECEECAEELILRYMRIILIKSRRMTTDPVYRDDLIQEGTLGFLNAVRTFDENKKLHFVTYADRCIVNRMLTAVNKESRKPEISSEEVIIEDKPDNITPESILLEKENELELDIRVKAKLSHMEMKIFRLISDGATYEQAAEELDISKKAVDNAMQRVRKKLKSAFKSE